MALGSKFANGNGRLITIFGGSGFVGRHAVRALAKNGWRIRAAERRPDLAIHLQTMGAVGQIGAVQANLRYPQSVARAVQGADAVINLVGILKPSGKQSFKAVHIEGAQTVARAARKAGAAQMLHLSALGAAAKAKSRYARSKAAGEAAVLSEFPESYILRPSLIFGPEDQFFNRFANMARISPLLPLIGGGRTRFQPVYVGDVAAAICACLDGHGQTGTIYELAGPQVITMRKLLDKVKIWSGRDRGYLPMPFWLAKLMALATWPLPNTLRPLTVDQIRLLQSDSVVSEEASREGRTLTALGINHPHSIDVIVPAYLEQFRPNGQYAHYRG